VDLVARYPDGSASEAFAYDVVERAGIDAVVLVVFERVAGQREIYVRSAVRAPLALRAGCDAVDASIWELPAGIVDPGESPRAAAAREIEEELGFDVSAESLLEFAPWTWPAPSFIAERQHFFCVDVTGTTRGTPSEDGSALERGAVVLRLTLASLLERCRAGGLRDAKTELALRRFAELD
jgi:ADP-ribose pyrophosphatase